MVQSIYWDPRENGFQYQSIRLVRCEQGNRWKTMHNRLVRGRSEDFTHVHRSSQGYFEVDGLEVWRRSWDHNRKEQRVPGDGHHVHIWSHSRHQNGGIHQGGDSRIWWGHNHKRQHTRNANIIWGELGFKITGFWEARHIPSHHGKTSTCGQEMQTRHIIGG